jgi:hypothetical protein
MRLEVYAANGAKAFDNEIRGGNVIDWLLQDGQTQRLSDGSYLCVITTKSLSGRMSQKLGRLTIENTAASLHPIDTTQLTAQQTQAVGPLEENASLTVLKEGETQTATVIAHNGTEGQLIRGRGALSFRIGDFYSGKDTEQMRLTPEGNLGIGITHPAVKLDVDGLIRSTQGIIFADGSIQLSAARKTFGAGSLRPGQSLSAREKDAALAPDTSGTGTTGKIPLWLDGPNGVLTDSDIFDTPCTYAHCIGIGAMPAANSPFKLDVRGHNRFAAANVSFYLTGEGNNEWVFQTVDADRRLRFFDNRGGGERFTISQSGNVGIGTTTPQSMLDVRGSLTLEAGSSPGLFTGTGNVELNRYLALLNSPTSPSASGLKAGGILVSDSYSFANPGKNDLIVKGNVGIGTAPSSKLTLQTPTNNYGLTHTDGAITLGEVVGNNAGWFGTLTNHQLNLFANNLPPSIVIATNGNVGIGTTAPSSKVEIAAQDGLKISGFQPFLTLLDTNGGNKSSFMQGVNGDVVLLTNSRAALVVKDITGDVVVGTASASGKLTVDGGTGPAVWGISTGGAGVYGTTSASSSAGVFGDVATGASSGVYGRNTSPTSLGAGVTGQGTSGPALKAIGSNLGNDLVQGHTCVPGCSERFHITSTGTYVAGSDFAEALPARGDKTSYEPGDVLIVSTDAPGLVEKSSQPYDARVAGVFSTRPGILGANKNGATRVDPGDLPVAIVGVVPTKVSTENGAVQVGDLLTTSGTPGYAMRCTDRLRCIGAIVGKAMEPLRDQKGVIKVLVMLR